MAGNNKTINPLRDLSVIMLSIILAFITYWLDIDFLNTTAKTVADIFIKFLQLMSSPIVFLAIINNFLSISEQKHLKSYSKKIVFYTILTTIFAAFIAYLLYNVFMPAVDSSLKTSSSLVIDKISGDKPSYLTELMNMFPSNIIMAFAENNILGVALIAAIMGIAMTAIPSEQKKQLTTVFSGLFHTFINIARFIITILPVGIWAFTVLFLLSMADNSISFNGLYKYFLVIVSANLIQGFIVLPAILKYKNISPIQLLKAVYPALTTAFFAKSSSAALPISMDCMIERRNIKEELARFSLPICTIINMNGCAAFIYTTVIFVATLAGYSFSALDYILWIFIATIVAIGNASVPMGCYFLSSAILVGMGVPLTVMGLILPIYTFIDMVETALNVWSDCCVTEIVAQES